MNYFILCKLLEMVDNNAAKTHLNNVETTLNNLDDVSKINSIIAARSLDLARNLTSNNLFLDQSLVNNIESISNRLNGHLVNDANSRISDLENERVALPAGDTSGRIAEIGAEILRLRGIANTLGGATANVSNRFNEYLTLRDCANLFNLNNNLGDLDIDTTGGRTGILSLSPFGTAGTLANHTFLGHTISPKYTLCDESGNEIRKSGGNYKINIGGVEYTIGGIVFRGGNLDCSAITITPALHDSPLEITLSINASYDNVIRDINVVCNKKFKLRLNDGTHPLNNVERGTLFDNYNNGHNIGSIIETKFAINRYKIEREVLEKILKKNGGTKYDTLSSKQKEEFYQIVRRLPVGGLSYFNSRYAAENLTTPESRYDEFKNWFTNDGKDWNKGDNIKKEANYITFMHNNINKKIDDFLSDKLTNSMGTLSEENHLKSELTRFLNKIERNKLDNNLNELINTDITGRGHKMDKGPRSLIHNRDTNYMRFFSDSSISFKGEKVDIHTNTTPDSIDNPEPVKYDMNLKITSKNNISVDIKIEGTNEIISHKSGEPSTLIRKIMRDQRINQGKVRAHIGFNIYKAMIQLAKQKNISLQYRDNSNHTRLIDIENGNVIIRQIDNLTTLNQENGEIIFDQDKFINLNIFDENGNNGALRQGLDAIGIHFNLAMNRLHKQYRQGTERSFLGLISSRNKFSLPTSFWQSPIKKILNRKDYLDFNFSTNVNSGGKNISIEFQKNKFTINMDGLQEPISSKDLGKLLNHREKRIRVFDGKERDILEGIYTTLISELRKNSKINRTDFGVIDNITGNMYVLDQDGEFGLITKEDLKTYGNPVKGSIRKAFGSLSQAKLSGLTVRKLDNAQIKELLRNPFLMQRLIKAMNHRMGLYSSIVSAFIK